jgi:hypothetical protein
MVNTVASWEPGSEVTLCNVNFNNDYRDHTNKVLNPTQYDLFLDQVSGPRLTISRVIYHKPGQPIKLPIPLNQAFGYNYLRVRNSAPNDFAKTFYYFITEPQFLSPSATLFNLQLDVWATFFKDVTLGVSYLERGHGGVANANRMVNNGRDFLTTPEPLDLGSAYNIVEFDQQWLGDQTEFAYLMYTTVSVESRSTSGDGTGIKNAESSEVEHLPQGHAIYLFTENDRQVNGRTVMSFSEFMATESQAPWVLQGIGNIFVVPINLIDNIFQYGDYTFETIYLPTGEPSGKVAQLLRWANFGTNEVAFNFGPGGINEAVAKVLGDRYKHLDKFYCSPYTMLEVTTRAGQPVGYKPELFEGRRVAFNSFTYVGGGGPRTAIMPQFYNAFKPEVLVFNGKVIYDGGEYIDNAVWLDNYPQSSVTINSYLNYMASNRASIQQQRNSANWAQTRALAGADLSNRQAMQNISTSTQQADLQTQQNLAATQIANDQAVLNAGVNILGSAASAGLGGAGAVSAGIGGVTTLASTAIQMDTANKQTALTNQGIVSANSINVANANFMADTNLQYAQMAAKGDYANTIAAIDAKVQDAQMMSPGVAGQTGGDGFATALASGFRIWCYVKMISPEAIQRVGDYWLRYGYAVNRFIKPPENLSVMTKFSYWKFNQTYLVSSTVPENYKQALRGILEKGITIWENPADIGRTELSDNKIKPGFAIDYLPRPE